MTRHNHQSSQYNPWWLVFIFISLLLLITGCADLRQQAVDLWPFNKATPTPTTLPISLLGWVGSEAENSLLQQTIATFEQTHPGSPVAGRLIPEYGELLMNELDSDSPPDLFLAYSHQLSDLVDEGQLLPIPSRYPVGDAIAPNLAQALQVDGKNYCFPRDVALLALFYNRAVFDRAEAAHPQSNWGWTEFRTAIDATADINNGYYGLTQDYDLSRFMPFLLQSNVDSDLWQGDDALAAIEYYMDLYNDEVAAVPGRLDSAWNGEAFGRGRAAMTIEGNWMVNYLANEFPALDYGIVELPTGQTARGTTAFITCWVVNADAPNPEAAFELAAFLTAPAQVAAWADVSGNLPPTIEQTTAWIATHPQYSPFAAALPYATPWYGPAGFLDKAATVNLSMDMWYKDNMTTPELIRVLATMSENPPLPTPTATPSD